MIEIHVENDDTEQRIDRYLRKKYLSASPGFIQKLLRTNKIRVNGERVKTGDFRVFDKDIISLYITEEMRKNISEERI
jgi:23S rRNA pseudouridine955/2504/2580 synthase